MENNKYEHIPAEKFEFANRDREIHDEKLQTKARGYFADALIRFKKNKSSVAAAFIIGFLVLFAIVAPIISPYTMKNKDNTYAKLPPFIESIAEKGWGILDGSVTYDSQSQFQLNNLYAMGVETGKNPVISVPAYKTEEEIYRGKPRTVNYYEVEVNAYYAKGMSIMIVSEEEFYKIQQWQNENGIQVLYPCMENKDIYPTVKANNLPKTKNANVWWVCKDTKNTPKTSDGKDDNVDNRIPAYSTNQDLLGKAGNRLTYDSLRIDGDPAKDNSSADGYVYGIKKSGSVEVRVFYYNYYQYKNNCTPTYLFGTDVMGRDLFLAIGMGARFSLIFAIVVSAINLTIGAIYGAIQGYYGGLIDLTLDRISDILSGVPFMIVATLFQLHLAQKVGPVVSFLFAFVLTGWIGMAALTRKQFYRFKSQEYVMAARTLGAGDRRLMFKHIFPNAIGTMITSCALVIPGVISSETSLTYLGIINLDSFVGTSIGSLVADGRAAISSAPHAMLFPSLFISLLLISFNLFGNGLRDAFNPSMRGADE